MDEQARRGPQTASAPPDAVFDRRAMEACRRVLAHFGRPTRNRGRWGGGSELARRISARWPESAIGAGGVNAWVVVPKHRVEQVVALAGGALTPADVRPDLYQAAPQAGGGE